MIVGKVKSGQGGASKIPQNVFEARRKASGVDLQRGTLNVHVKDLPSSILSLGQFYFQTDLDAPRGPLNWWKIIVFNEKLDKSGIESFVVRHERTTTDYIEIMSHVIFRNIGIVNEDIVSIQLRNN